MVITRSNATGTLAIKRGRCIPVSLPSTFDQANIREYVDGSYYNYGVLDAAGLHPFDGKTTPNMGYRRLQLDQGAEIHGRNSYRQSSRSDRWPVW